MSVCLYAVRSMLIIRKSKPSLVGNLLTNKTYFGYEDGHFIRQDGRVWQQYKECLEQFFIANLITANDKKRAVFLSVVGAETFKVLRSWRKVVCGAPPEADYSPKPSEIVERFKFHTCFRKPCESVATYLAQLRALSKYCNFGASLDP